MKTTVLAAIAVMGMAVSGAQASTFTFPFVTLANANTDLGLSASFLSNGMQLLVYGLTAPADLNKPATGGPNLYAKNGGVGETGLGMAVDPENDHEISAQLHDGIQVDFSDPLSKLSNATVTMVINSSQPGEGWAIYGSNTKLTVAGNSKTMGWLGEPLISGTGTYANSSTTVTLPYWGQYTYYTLMATDPQGSNPLANVLMGTITLTGTVTTNSTPTPEPATFVMMGLALIGLSMAMKKMQKKG